MSRPRFPLRPLGFLAALVAGLVLGYALRSGSPTEGPAPASSATEEAAQPQVWTCSMHPQIRKSGPGKCPICGMDLVPVHAPSPDETASLRRLVVRPAERELMRVRTAPVERRYVDAVIRMVGKVDYDETRLAYITAWAAGRIDELYVDYTGVEVRKGDHMAYLYSPELYAAQEELLQAKRAARELAQGEFEDVLRTSEATLEAAREKLRLLGLTPEQVAQVEERGTPSDHVTLYAPVGGLVIHKNAQEGMYVDVGTRIFTIADLKSVWVMLDAYESDLTWLRFGQEVQFEVEAYPGETFDGRVSFIDPVMNPQTRTVKVRVVADNADGRLKPEMFVHARVRAKVAAHGKVMDPHLVGKWISPMHTQIVKDEPGACDICGMPLVPAESLGYVSPEEVEKEKPLVIPATAPLLTGRRAVVYVEVPDAEEPTYEGREVVLGPRAGDFYIVRHGLEEGERVVIEGNFKIDSAVQILAKPSMMSPEGGQTGGMHHHGGGGAMKAGGAMGTELDAEAREILAELERSAASITRIDPEVDLDAFRAASEDFGRRVEAIDAERFGPMGAVWNEIGMRLRNDAFEGAEVRTASEARDVLRSLRANLESMRRRFGTKAPSASHGEMEVPAAVREGLRPLWEGYAELHEKLVADDLEGARRAVEKLSAWKAAFRPEFSSAGTRSAWTALAGRLQAALDALQAASDLETLRAAFQPFAQVLGEVVQGFGGPELEAVFLLRCPMALEGRGATWIQADPEIRNPYMGSAMPDCGTLLERIPVAHGVEAGHDH